MASSGNLLYENKLSYGEKVLETFSGKDFLF